MAARERRAEAGLERARIVGSEARSIVISDWREDDRVLSFRLSSLRDRQGGKKRRQGEDCGTL